MNGGNWVAIGAAAVGVLYTVLLTIRAITDSKNFDTIQKQFSALEVKLDEFVTGTKEWRIAVDRRLERLEDHPKWRT